MFFNKDVLEIKETDTLWKFYQKSFTLDNQEIMPPKNFCQYFWTSVTGFQFWITREVKLWKLWVLFFGAFFLMLFCGSIFDDSVYRSHHVIFNLLAVIFVVPLAISCFAIIFASFHCLTRFIDARPKLERGLGISILVLCIGFFLFITRNSGIDFVGQAIPILKFAALLVGLATVITITISTLLFLWTKIPGDKKSNFAKVLKSFFAALEAKKRKICPLVESPPEFTRNHK